MEVGWRFSGVLGVGVIWGGVVVAMNRAGLGLVDNRPLSYLGVDPASAQWFSISLLVSAVLFLLFGLYVRRVYDVHNKFFLYLLIGQIGQVIAAVSPYGKDSPWRLVHTVAAFVLAFSLPLLMREFTIAQTGKPRYRLFRGLLRLEQVTFIVGIGLFIFTKGIAPLGEALPAIGYHLWIIAVAIVAPSRRDL